jgi:cytochrome c oxidase subunit 4
MMIESPSLYRRNVLVGAALLLLLAITTASAFVPMGAWNALANLVIAAIKVGLIAAFFMHLDQAGGLVRMMAAIGVAMLLVFLSLSATDYARRVIQPAPWQGTGAGHYAGPAGR